MAIPLIVKAGGVAWLLWELFRGKKETKPPEAKAPENPVVRPEPATNAATQVEPIPALPAPKPMSSCSAPVLAKRWTICEGGATYAVGAVTSQGTYDALYHPTTHKLVAVIDNSTYSDDGNSAWVAAMPLYINPTTQKTTGPDNPSSLWAGYLVAPTRTGEVPFFPADYKGL